jgi:hypothetical protein
VYRRLISHQLGASYLRYGFALIEALVIAKVILIGKAMGLGKRLHGRPLIFSVLRSSVAYGALVAAFAVLENVVEGLVTERRSGELRRVYEPGVRRDPGPGVDHVPRVPSVVRLLGSCPAGGRTTPVPTFLPRRDRVGFGGRTVIRRAQSRWASSATGLRGRDARSVPDYAANGLSHRRCGMKSTKTGILALILAGTVAGGTLAAAVDKSECGAQAAGLWGCRFDASGVETLDEKNDELTVVTVQK